MFFPLYAMSGLIVGIVVGVAALVCGAPAALFFLRRFYDRSASVNQADKLVLFRRSAMGGGGSQLPSFLRSASKRPLLAPKTSVGEPGSGSPLSSVPQHEEEFEDLQNRPSTPVKVTAASSGAKIHPAPTAVESPAKVHPTNFV